MKLNATNVHDTFMKCLFVENEDTTNHVAAKGIVTHVGFHPERLKENTQNILDMLDELPDDFKANVGGGMSFLSLGVTKEDVYWGEHQTMDQLVCLGLAINKLEYCLPRELWSALPGGVPYIVIKE